MEHWSAGYIADIPYTFGYYYELNPLRSRLAFLFNGLQPPVRGGAHCELGFGQGLSVNIHAAGSGYIWYGNDFNPSHVNFAKEVADVSGAKAYLSDESFADFCSRNDLPEFDSIALHGVWSWISDANRSVIVDFIRRKLKVGGLLYMSYNTQPGWASFAPLRDLLTEHSEVMGVKGDRRVSRIDNALKFAEDLMGTNPAYLKANPGVFEQLQDLKQKDRSYLAHEYFNRDWLPMKFSSVTQWLQQAKVTFACSADYLSNIPEFNFTKEQEALLNGVHDPMLKETIRDFVVNQRFRKDYWVKGARTLRTSELIDALRGETVMLAVNREDAPLKARGPAGESDLSHGLYSLILDALADYEPKTLEQVEQALKTKDVKFPQIVKAIMVLASSATLLAVNDASAISRAKSHTVKLNAWLMDRSRKNGDVNFLASPVTGGAIPVHRFEQLFLLARKDGLPGPSEWAKFAWMVLQAQGGKLIKEGKPLESPEDNLIELTTKAKKFESKRLCVLQALQVI